QLNFKKKKIMKQNKFKKQIIKSQIYNIKYTLKEEVQYFESQLNCYFYTVIESPQIVVKLSDSNIELMNQYYQQEVFAWTKIKEEKTLIPLLKQNENYHPNLLETKAAFRQQIKDNELCVLILEYCPKGSLQQIFDKLPQYAMKEIQIIRIGRDILQGLYFLQTRPNPLIHRNINMKNILFGEDNNYKIGNFQNVTTHQYQSISSDEFASVDQEISKNSSEGFRAPEQLYLNLGYPINEMVDVYAVGVILYILCYNKNPFNVYSVENCNKQIELPDFPKYSKNLQTLIQKLLTPNPFFRPKPLVLLQFILSCWQDLKIPQTNTGLLDNNIFKNIQEIEIKQNTISKLMIFMYNKSTKGWLLATLQENQEEPNQNFIQKLIIKAWQKKEKIQKFYEMFLQFMTIQNTQNTIICLKSLILLHNYVKKGPLETVFKNNGQKKGSSNDILNQIISVWQNIDPKDNSQDKIRSIFTTKLINMYAQRLRQKINLANQYSGFLEGNFSLKPFLDNVGKNNNNNNNNLLKWQLIEDLLNYMNQLVVFSNEILSQNIIMEIQMSVYVQLVDEMYCLLCTLTFLLVCFIKSSVFLEQNQSKCFFEGKIQEFKNSYENLFDQCLQFFKKFSHFKNFVSILVDHKVLEFVLGLKSFQNEEFNIFSFLNYNKSIFGLYLPLSYGVTIPSIQDDLKKDIKFSGKKKELKNDELKQNSISNSFEKKNNKTNKKQNQGILLVDQDQEDFNLANQYEQIEIENKNQHLLQDKQNQEKKFENSKKTNNSKKSLYKEEEKSMMNESYDEENEQNNKLTFAHQTLNQQQFNNEQILNSEQYKNINFWDFSDVIGNNIQNSQQFHNQKSQSAINFYFNDQQKINQQQNDFELFDNFSALKNQKSMSNQATNQNFDFWNFSNVNTQKQQKNENQQYNQQQQQFKYQLNFNNNNIEKTIQMKNQQQNDIFQEFKFQNFDYQQNQNQMNNNNNKQQNFQEKIQQNQWQQNFNQLQQQQNNWQNFKQNENIQEFNNNNNQDNELDNHNSTSSYNSESIQELKQFIINRVQHNPKNIIINFNRLTFGKQIGSGHSAKVYKGLFNQLEVAIKEINYLQQE
ncbi:protein kinase domain protein, partial [Ichthyophthirius multifiliis]